MAAELNRRDVTTVPMAIPDAVAPHTRFGVK